MGEGGWFFNTFFDFFNQIPHPPFRPVNFWSGGWTDPFGCVWRGGLYVTNIVINSVTIFGWWTGGCIGCGVYQYNGGASSCDYCTFWNGYQVLTAWEREREQAGD